MLTWNQIQARAVAFSKKWQGASNEEAAFAVIHADLAASWCPYAT